MNVEKHGELPPLRELLGIAERKASANAVKHDTGKADWSMLPVEPMREVVRVYDIGKDKYGRNNWRRGMDYSRVFAAMMRHAWAWWSGEQRDPEDGQHHLASVAWCALTLMWYELKGKGNDDRDEAA